MVELARVDFRLIHGQIIAKWRRFCNIDHIVVIDDILATDEFMTRVYASSVPAGVELTAYTEADALRVQRKTSLGAGEHVLILFKDISACYRCVKAGLKLTSIQLGGIPSAQDRKQVSRGVFLNDEDVTHLRELHDSFGMEITVQDVPEDVKMDYNELLRAYRPEEPEKENTETC